MQSLDLSNFPPIPLPRFVRIKQKFAREKIGDIPGELNAKLAPVLADVAGKRIAVGVGSRGVANIALITKTVVDALLRAGAKPFIIPAVSYTHLRAHETDS